MGIVTVHHQHIRTLKISHAAPASLECSTNMVIAHSRQELCLTANLTIMRIAHVLLIATAISRA